MSDEDTVSLRLRESRELVEEVMKDLTISNSISELSDQCIERITRGGKLVFFGNGGSAADAQHLAAEFVGRYLVNRPAIPSIALTTDSSVLTAISNDFDFSTIFSRQVEALVGVEDVVFGISTSGNSENVVKGLSAAKNKGALTVSFTGQSGGKASAISDFCISIPSDSTPLIQQMHITIGHILCEIIETSLVARESHENSNHSL